MRIISQDGLPYILDFPYESVAIEQRANAVYARYLCDTHTETIAVYSKSDFAQRALDMLHEAYKRNFLLWPDREHIHYCVVNAKDIFRFPREDEI